MLTTKLLSSRIRNDELPARGSISYSGPWKETMVDVRVTQVRDDLFEVGMKPRSRQSRDNRAKGMIRKLLELTLLGSTFENNYLEFGDIRLEVEGLDRDHWHVFGQTSQDVYSFA